MSDIIKDDLKINNLDELEFFEEVTKDKIKNLEKDTEIIIELSFANQQNDEEYGGYFKGFLAENPKLNEDNHVYYFKLKKDINNNETVNIDTWGSCSYSVKKKIQVNYEELKFRECTGNMLKRKRTSGGKKSKIKTKKYKTKKYKTKKYKTKMKK